MVFRASERSVSGRSALGTYFFENGSPLRIPSLLRMNPRLSHDTDLLHGGAEAAGNMTSGGTESIIMAVRRPGTMRLITSRGE
jgi:hypothetical protein